ncbi:MAG: polar growth protein [Caeruleum heppii]|nr:MAG: polar growth protein [Caeruleum heppii]
MALRSPIESPKRAMPGHILLVVHDFEARSPDELSLAKGDRIELIERDDDFGDGWYLGRHMHNGNTGLFPEVYTTSAPKGTTSLAAISASNPRPFNKITIGSPPPTANTNGEALRPPTSHGPTSDSSQAVKRDGKMDGLHSDPAAPSPLNMTPPPQVSDTATSSSAGTPTQPVQSAAQRTLSLGTAGHQRPHGEDSPVMNETLSVIQEHITDMSTPRHSFAAGADMRGTNDSGSDYSSQLDPRLSYITGHETDEEEQNAHSEAEIMKWSANRVAEYLGDVGVDQKQCDVFVEQEITGEVLLGMDQSSLFIKDLELGPVGRRLRTWHKIKALQDEARSVARASQKSTLRTSTSGGDSHLEENERSRSSTPGTVLPKIPSLMQKPIAKEQTRPDKPIEHQSLRPPDAMAPKSVVARTAEPARAPESPTRPSAANVRAINHTRRHSSVDQGMPLRPTGAVNNTTAASSARNSAAPHQKTPSFDRNWTMGSAAPMATPRPGSIADSAESSGLSGPPSRPTASVTGLGLQEGSYMSPVTDLDRGYFSGGEVETRRTRNVLRKRDTSHSRNSSYTDEHRQRGSTAHHRHSRFGSADSVRDPSFFGSGSAAMAASQAYGGRQFRGRTPRVVNGDTNLSSPASRNSSSPAVTKLEYGKAAVSFADPTSPSSNAPSSSGQTTPSTQADPLASKPRVTGLRAISDAVTTSERAAFGSSATKPTISSTSSPIQSPARTGFRTANGVIKGEGDTDTGPSTKGSPLAGGMGPSTSGTVKRKVKSQTSAYIRGLEKKSPQEQMVGCDYSGWMKKKSTNLMTTWKARLFVLRGRRLSYYYTENDVQEKGLIDISSHRVLPADNDRITGLHATLTGASNSPTSPQNASMPTTSSIEAASQADEKGDREGGDAMFIFKLVPPRLGLSKAVNFTKPTVHYFAVDNVKQGRLWMAALMKATIDRDDSKPLMTTYTQKTISLAKARQMRHRPPALMGLEENATSDGNASNAGEDGGLNIKNVDIDGDVGENDSGISGLDKRSETAKKTQSLKSDGATADDGASKSDGRESSA